jgi:hypothetical protein
MDGDFIRLTFDFISESAFGMEFNSFEEGSVHNGESQKLLNLLTEGLQIGMLLAFNPLLKMVLPDSFSTIISTNS